MSSSESTGFIAEGYARRLVPDAQLGGAHRVFFIVAGSLCGLPIALKDPVAKLASHRMNCSEEATVHKSFQLPHTWQKEFVLNYSVLNACGLGLRRQLQCHRGIVCQWLFTVDMFSRGDRGRYAGRPE